MCIIPLQYGGQRIHVTNGQFRQDIVLGSHLCKKAKYLWSKSDPLDRFHCMSDLEFIEQYSAIHRSSVIVVRLHYVNFYWRPEFVIQYSAIPTYNPYYSETLSILTQISRHLINQIPLSG